MFVVFKDFFHFIFMIYLQKIIKYTFTIKLFISLSVSVYLMVAS